MDSCYHGSSSNMQTCTWLTARQLDPPFELKRQFTQKRHRRSTYMYSQMYAHFCGSADLVKLWWPGLSTDSEIHAEPRHSGLILVSRGHFPTFPTSTGSSDSARLNK